MKGSSVPTNQKKAKKESGHQGKRERERGVAQSRERDGDILGTEVGQ